MRFGRINTLKTRTAFTLIEVVIAVMVLAIAVPPTLSLLDSAGAGRADAINTNRASLLATSVLETIIADINSNAEGLGFDALGDSNVYLNTPDTGLYARLETIVSPYIDAGLGYAVEVGALVAADGSVSEDANENIFRIVTVRVSFTSASTASYQVPFSTMVSAI